MISILRLRNLLTVLLMGSALHADYSVSVKNEIAKTVVRYAEGMQIAGRSGKVDHLRPFATDKIVNKTYLWIHSWQDSNLYMRAELQKIDFKDFRIDRNISSVRTWEEWEYDYYDAAAKKSAMPKTRAIYQMKYSLYSHQGKWIIDNITVLNEKQTSTEKQTVETKVK